VKYVAYGRIMFYSGAESGDAAVKWQDYRMTPEDLIPVWVDGIFYVSSCPERLYISIETRLLSSFLPVGKCGRTLDLISTSFKNLC
jgi:hypothetical protein